ncbi:peptidoglycan-binding protein [Streptomyces spiroverticillatus]|uniref:Peptidoglycan-binding protein n=1 Tax=Streptomyces finlayi TaxID=67296 RepID=A0A918X4P6_9ACTN|nr:peptidoglycan-binding protein [Streptomyces finlayi]GHA34296.1 peptidoglycan-binding protein [Streptomyces spiroverticillatus]GHD11872.1 peptidoglycan-binding protein [Streptomyces finlayi]
MTKRRTALLAVGTLSAAAAVTAGVLVLGDGGGADAKTGPSLPGATATVVRTDLVQSKTVDGKLDFAQRRPVKAVVEGTVTVAAKEGRVLGLGDALYELNDKPVTLLYGPVPMFREMKAGDRGSDVLQLERNLRDLGFGAKLYVDPRYDKDTEAAVKRWQKSLNREPTGRVGMGDVVFQRGKVKVVAADAALADQVAPGKAVLTVASTKPVVRAQLDQSDGALAADGTRVEITLPSGKSARGRVLGTVRPEEDDASTGAGARADGITVEVELTGGATEASGEDPRATASVKFVSESRKGVLVVPVEAVLALRGERGGYGLQVVEGDTSKMVRVETGMTADGQIEVTGAGVREGLKVGVAKS